MRFDSLKHAAAAVKHVMTDVNCRPQAWHAPLRV
jgi:hypothetical protein